MLYYKSYLAVGTECTLVISSDNQKINPEKIFNNIASQIYLFERQFSRFIPSSELTLFNKKAGIKQIISPMFREILFKAKDISKLTNEIYNPFILPTLQKVGYDKSFVSGFKDDSQIDYSNRALTTIDNLILGDNWAEIPYGTAIDLGGCGKGFLADQLAAQMLDLTDIKGYWLSLGGDIIFSGVENDNLPWKIYIQKNDPDLVKNIGFIEVKLKYGETFSIATSSIDSRSGIKNNKPWHHLIDPRTNLPAETDLKLATVASDNTMFCDVMSKVVLILGQKTFKQALVDYHIENAIIQGYDKSKQNYYKKAGSIINILE